jgi:dihydroceramidase
LILPDSVGVWGTPTSTVDWCEANYAVTPFICEFFNTVSSVAMVVAGGLGILLHRRVLDRWMLLAFGLLSVVGLGSIAFHATLKFEFQMLDELPMLYLVTLMAYLVLEPGPTRRFGAWLPWTLLGYAIVATMSATLTRGRFQFFAFQITFGALELYCLLRVYRLSRELGNERIRAIFRTGVALYVAAIGFWFVDVRFCPAITQGWPAVGLSNPQLHAWWHVLVSCGFYLLLLVVGYDRLRRAGAQASINEVGGVIPAVALSA